MKSASLVLFATALVSGLPAEITGGVVQGKPNPASVRGAPCRQNDEVCLRSRAQTAKGLFNSVGASKGTGKGATGGKPITKAPIKAIGNEKPISQAKPINSSKPVDPRKGTSSDKPIGKAVAKPISNDKQVDARKGNNAAKPITKLPTKVIRPETPANVAKPVNKAPIKPIVNEKLVTSDKDAADDGSIDTPFDSDIIVDDDDTDEDMPIVKDNGRKGGKNGGIGQKVLTMASSAASSLKNMFFNKAFPNQPKFLNAPPTQLID